MEASSSSAEAARAKAEARRQKILARQKDRLSAITGTYAQPGVPGGYCYPISSSGCTGVLSDTAGWWLYVELGDHHVHAETANPQTVLSAPREEPADPRQDVAVGEPASTSAQQDWQEQQLESLLAAAQARLQQAQAMAQESAHDAGGVSDEASAHTPAMPQSQPPGPGNPHGLAGSTAHSDTVAPFAPYMRLGAKLGAAATRTRPARLLAAVLLAYALSAGLLHPHRVVLSPVLCVTICGLCIVFGGLLLGHEVQQSEDELENALPMRLRQFNLTALFPSAKEALQGLLGFRNLVNGLSEDVSAYLVTCAMLIALTNYWHDRNNVWT